MKPAAEAGLEPRQDGVPLCGRRDCLRRITRRQTEGRVRALEAAGEQAQLHFQVQAEKKEIRDAVCHAVLGRGLWAGREQRHGEDTPGRVGREGGRAPEVDQTDRGRGVPWHGPSQIAGRERGL